VQIQCQAAAVRQVDCSKFSDPQPRNSCRQITLTAISFEAREASMQQVSMISRPLWIQAVSNQHTIHFLQPQINFYCSFWSFVQTHP